VYAASVTRERAITRLELVRATVSGQKGWVAASWRRADGSKGSVTVRFLLKDERRFFLAQLLVDAPTSGLLRDIPLARIEQAANVDPQIRDWIWDSLDLEVDAQGRPIWKRHRLRRPSGRRLDDAFYARVATAYLGAVAHGVPPARTLSEDSDTPQGTVNKWIATARAKNMLPKTTRGKASDV
jgi:hypothetical protein